ncbi:MAG: isoprenylcysteine carboxylmethyltransferase family protein [Candidatus Woesearchaeota archaeon]
MPTKMSRFGIGPWFATLSIIYTLIVLGVSHFFLPLQFYLVSLIVNYVLGAILIFFGLVFFFLSAYQLHRNFNSEKLQTKGAYAFMRHPIYGTWIVFIVPGLVLIFPYLLGITIPFVMYGIFRLLIVKEEKYLLKRFGKKYLEYSKKVHRVFPF